MLGFSFRRLKDLIPFRRRIKNAIPQRVLMFGRRLQAMPHRLRGGRPPRTRETEKARPRREREGFFQAYCQGRGLDVGYGGDLLAPNCEGWDVEHGDAQYLRGAEDNSFDFVYSSHTLEHMVDPAVALRNWWRVIKPGGYLILYIPHRDLYEKKRTLPSRFNADHKHFFLVDRDDPPDTLGIVPLIARTLSNFDLVYAKECSEGHTVREPRLHSDGEFSIEVVLHKQYAGAAPLIESA
jgi:SAM-dependent methyltransferase